MSCNWRMLARSRIRTDLRDRDEPVAGDLDEPGFPQEPGQLPAEGEVDTPPFHQPERAFPDPVAEVLIVGLGIERRVHRHDAVAVFDQEPPAGPQRLHQPVDAPRGAPVRG